MQVKNTTKSYIGFSARLNPGAKVESFDPSGNKISKDALPEIVTIRIPPEATVEIDDKIWKAALKSSAKRQGVELVKEQVQVGISDKEKATKLNMTVPVGDGKQRNYNPVREMIDMGMLKVVAAAENEMSVDDLRKAIEDIQGYALPKDVAKDKLVSMYERLS